MTNAARTRTSSSSTSRRTVTFLAGSANVKASPLSIAPVTRPTSVRPPANSRPASVAVIRPATIWVPSSVLRPPNRSAMTPAHGPSTSGLENCAQVTRPTANTECASW